MTFELTHVALICVGYLLVIFGVAWITERKWVPKAITQHPLTYVLSLGIFASAWAFMGLSIWHSSLGMVRWLITWVLERCFCSHRLPWPPWRSCRADTSCTRSRIYWYFVTTATALARSPRCACC